MIVLFLRVLVVGIAAYRLARAVANDSISAPFRDWLWVAVYGEEPELDEYGAPVPVGGKFWQYAYALCSCQFCIGFWISLALYAAWVNWGPTRPFIVAVAVAGVAALLAGYDRALARVIDRD